MTDMVEITKLPIQGRTGLYFPTPADASVGFDVTRPFAALCTAEYRHVTLNVDGNDIEFDVFDSSVIEVEGHYAIVLSTMTGVTQTPMTREEAEAVHQAVLNGPLVVDVVVFSNLTDHIGMGMPRKGVSLGKSQGQFSPNHA